MNTQPAPTPAPAPAPVRGVAPFFAPLQREFDRVLADFSGFDLSDVFGASPRMDMREADGAVELTVELPGMTEDDAQTAAGMVALAARGIARSRLGPRLE